MKTPIYFRPTLFFSLFFSISFFLNAQNVGINGTGGNPHASALLDIDAVSTPSLGILIPRIPLQAINLAAPVTSPATSLLLYNTASASTGTNAVSPGYYYWDGAKWVRFAYNASGSSSTAWDLLGNAGTVDGTNFIGTTDNVPFNVRVNNQKAGRIDGTLGNVFWGLNAGNSNVSGNSLVAIGQSALNLNSTGIYNIAIGNNAMSSNTSGGFNVAIGIRALTSANSSLNVGVGVDALRFTTTGSGNVAVGINTAQNNITGNYNTALGNNCLGAHTTGDNNIAIGSQALSMVQNSLSTKPNIAIGTQALFGGDPSPINNILNDNVGVGYQAMYGSVGVPSTGTANVAVGNNALGLNTTGGANTAVGKLALGNNLSGEYNTAIGYITLRNNSASYNTAVGGQAMRSNTTGNQNIAFGNNALSLNTIGSANSASGFESMLSNTTGSDNTATGHHSLFDNVSGARNTAIGRTSLEHTLGNNNTAVGYYSGFTNVSGINNTFLGANADATAGTFTNATAIGYNAKVGSSNALVLGGTGADAVNVGIGMTTPLYPLQVINTNVVTPTAYLENTGGNNRALRAINSAAAGGGSGDGLYATTSQAIGNGVYARNLNSSGTGILGIGQNVVGSYLPAGSGVSASGDASGLVADADNATGTGIRAMGNGVGSYPSLVSGSGGAFAGTSRGVYGVANNTGNDVAGGYFTNGNNSFAFVGYTTPGGVAQKINGPGVVSTIVKNTKNELVNLYCPEAPEVLFQDFGKGNLVNGEAKILLDETFTKNVKVNDKHPLRVIIQLEGDCKGVFVTNKTANSFDVKELQGGNSNVAFTYFVTANRADAYNEDGSLFSKFEDVRFGEAPKKALTNDEKAERVNK